MPETKPQPQLKTLRLDQLRLDGDTQPRVMIDENVVIEYAELYRDGKTLAPVIVFFDGATYWLADGFHRYYASKNAGKEQVAAEVHIGMRRDAILHSVGANADHGLRRTNEDKRKAIQTLLKDEEWKLWSNYEIARKCLVHEKSVRRMRDALTTAKPQSKQEARTYKHNKSGKPTTMKTDKIGHSQKSSTNKTSASKKASGGKSSSSKCAPMALEVISLLRNEPRQSARKLVQQVEADYMVAFVDELDQIQQSSKEFQPIKRKGRDLKQTKLQLSHNPTRGAQMIIEAIGEEYAKELIVSLTNCINHK